MARPPRVEMGHWTERVGDQILFHSAPIIVPENTDGLSYHDVLRLNGIDVPPSPWAPAAKTKSSAPKPSRRRLIKPHPALSPDMLVLFRHFVETGMPLSRYAKEWLGVSRITLWSWFQNLSYPYPSTRAQIKARTGIDVGPDPLRRDR